jgi:hypothetical protein
MEAVVLGIALVQLLIVGVDVAMWPTFSEAKRAAVLVREGMTFDQVQERIGLIQMYVDYASIAKEHPGEWISPIVSNDYLRKFPDGSKLILTIPWDEQMIPSRVTHLVIISPPHVPPLTRLRRTFARLIPALKE